MCATIQRSETKAGVKVAFKIKALTVYLGADECRTFTCKTVFLHCGITSVPKLLLPPLSKDLQTNVCMSQQQQPLMTLLFKRLTHI